MFIIPVPWLYMVFVLVQYSWSLTIYSLCVWLLFLTLDCSLCVCLWFLILDYILCGCFMVLDPWLFIVFEFVYYFDPWLSIVLVFVYCSWSLIIYGLCVCVIFRILDYMVLVLTYYPRSVAIYNLCVCLMLRVLDYM